jgi:CheY-like chemotaxis protein
MNLQATSRSILIVEDDADIRGSLQDLLEGENYKVRMAANGQVALDTLRSDAELPGLILLDLMMPVKDGSAFREEQQRDARLATIPVVIMSAASEIAATSEQLGVREFVSKPINIDLLLGLVERHLG